jgi:putative inorganic carbon (HCO3(-)) transporter
MKTVRWIQGYSFADAARTYWFIIPCLLLASLFVGLVSAKMNYTISPQIALLTLIVFPAFILAFLHSTYLIPYNLLVWAGAPEIRRLADWLEGVYHPVSLLSLAPLISSATVIIPAIFYIHRMNRPITKVIWYFAIALAYGSMIGLMKNGISTIYDLANYVIPMLLIPYCTVAAFKMKDMDLMLRSFSNISVLVAIYGLIQYMVVPPWDAFWMNHVEMISIGNPLPLQIRVFSTMNSPGPTAQFFAFSLVPMIFVRKWRGALNWLGVVLVIICLLTTLVRSAWLILIVMILSFILTSASSMKWRLLFQVVTLGAVLYVAVPHLPGAEGLVLRMQTLSDISQDHSYNERLDLFHTMLPMVLHSPLGSGIGSLGQATKLENGGALGEFGVMDNGFIAIFFTFGIVGGFLYFRALWLLAKLIIKRIIEDKFWNLYTRLSLSAFAGAIASLTTDNGFPGLRGFLIWFLVGLGFGAKEMIDNRKEVNTAHAAAIDEN